MSLENLLKLVIDDKLNDDNIVPLLSFIDSSEEDYYLSPLLHAIYYGNMNSIRTLLKHGADKEKKVVFVYQRPDHDWDGGNVAFCFEKETSWDKKITLSRKEVVIYEGPENREAASSMNAKEFATFMVEHDRARGKVRDSRVADFLI